MFAQWEKVYEWVVVNFWGYVQFYRFGPVFCVSVPVKSPRN